MAGAVLNGACHCGAVSVSLETPDPDRVQLRRCQCSFCRRHGAMSASDPDGRLTIRGSALTRYRFGLKTADFLLCPVCGTYVGATIARGTEVRAIVNAAGTMLDRCWDKAGPALHYDNESEAERVARRLSQWMPVSLVEEAGRAHV